MSLPLWKQVTLSLYYQATMLLRRREANRRCSAGQAPSIVLFYHRVADDRASDWTASNRGFARQIAWLHRHFDMVSLAESQRRFASGHSERPSICITFDDGYAANCDQALPLLVREGVPCTYFVSTDHITSGRTFAHDAARGAPLKVNTPQQIVEMAEHGVEIGSHTRTHADLGPMDDFDQLCQELIVSRRELQQLSGQSVNYFAFPYGQRRNLNPLAFAIARQAGYLGVCSAYGGFNFPGDDPYHIQRIHVDEDLIRLKNWVTLDPRKLSVPRYQYRDEALPAELLAMARELSKQLQHIRRDYDVAPSDSWACAAEGRTS